MTARILAVIAVFFVLTGGAYAASAKNTLPRGAVDSRSIENGSITGTDIAKDTIKSGNLDLDSVLQKLQARLQGRCKYGEALRFVTVDGRISCTPLSKGSITGIDPSGGLTGGGTSGTVKLGTDPKVLQLRVDGSCSSNRALQSVGQDGTVGCNPFQVPLEDGGCKSANTAIRTANALTGAVECVPAVSKVTAGTGLTGGGGPGDVTIDADTGVLQRRVDGTCTGTNAIASIAQDGTVTCQATGTGTVTSVDVAPGSGLSTSPNPITTSGTIDTNFAVIQKRVTGTCDTAGNTGVQGLNADGTVDCGNLQNRVTGTCTTAGNTGVQGVNADGTVACGNLQNRVGGTCSTAGNNAIQAIAADGTTTCANLQDRVTGSCATTTNNAIQSIAADGTVTCGNLQRRVTGSCATTTNNAIQSIAADGTVSCGTLQQRVTGNCTTSSANVIQAINADGTVNCGNQQNPVTGTCKTAGGANAVQGVNANGTVDCGSLQERVTGTCTTAGNTAIQSVNANGTVNCANLQNRVTGTCSGYSSVQSVNADGTANCTSQSGPLGRSVANFPSDIPAGQTITLLDLGQGQTLSATCTSASPPKAEISVTSNGGANIVWNTPQQGFQGVGPVALQKIASSTGLDGGTYSVGGTAGVNAGHTAHGQFYLFAGAASCQFSASGVTN